jgi:hypothetical protein
MPFLEAFEASEQSMWRFAMHDRGSDTITVRVSAARSQLQIARQPAALMLSGWHIPCF